MRSEGFVLRLSNTAELPVQKQGRARVNTLLFIGSIFALLLLSVLAVHFYTHRGWTILDISAAALAVDPVGEPWVVDTSGMVWMAEGTRLLHPDGESTQIPLLADDKVTCLAVGRQGQVWVGTFKGNVILYSTNKEWIIYTPELLTERIEIGEIAVDGFDRVWVRNKKAGLGSIDPNQHSTTYSYQYSLSTGSRITALTIDNQGQVWVINNGESIGQREVKVLGPDDRWRTYAPIRAKDYYTEGDLAVDRFGRVWIGAYLKDEIGILDSDGNLLTYVVDDHPIRYASPRFLVFDVEHRLWGTDIGLFMLGTNGTLSVYDRMISGFPDGAIKALSIDAGGRIWILSWPNKLTVFDVENSFPPASYQTIRFMSITALLLIPSLVLCIAWIFANVNRGDISFNIIRDFYIGVLGWFAIVTFFWLAAGYLARLFGPGASGWLTLCLVAPLPMHVIGSLLLYRKWRAMAIGAMGGFIVNTIGTLLMFSSLSFSSPTPYILGMVPFFMILN